jgi:hypothetical protein
MSAGSASRHCQNRLEAVCFKALAPSQPDSLRGLLPPWRRAFHRRHLARSVCPRRRHRTRQTSAEIQPVPRAAVLQQHSRWTLRFPCVASRWHATAPSMREGRFRRPTPWHRRQRSARHRVQDLQSLALHEEAIRLIRQDPYLRQQAEETLGRWLRSGNSHANTKSSSLPRRSKAPSHRRSLCIPVRRFGGTCTVSLYTRL